MFGNGAITYCHPPVRLAACAKRHRPLDARLCGPPTLTRTVSGVVTCHFTMDNRVDKVWVDGVDMTSEVQGSLSKWDEKKTLTFSGSPSMLAIKGRDDENGNPSSEL